jgi:protease-4
MANRGSIVGSIGVIFDGINYKELMDKIGLYPQTMKAGKYKEAGTGAREWLPYEKEEIESLINTSYDMFVTDVATARGLDINHSTEFADAHIFKASKAMEVGLIDSTGTIIDAEKRVEELAGVHKPVWEKESEMEKLMASLSTKIFGEISSSFDWKMR